MLCRRQVPSDAPTGVLGLVIENIRASIVIRISDFGIARDGCHPMAQPRDMGSRMDVRCAESGNCELGTGNWELALTARGVSNGQAESGDCPRFLPRSL